MNGRRVSTPPDLPGYEFLELIGSGGYADVFLYQQVAPRRQVAIKIVDTAVLDGRTATDYTEEANVMAMVSAHPHIVQVFQASVSPDGRPFLVMEYYPNQNFHDRARREQLSVAEVLRVGIQVASAVETAHRAGILHRDIKPANILTSEFNHPGLTDFGIAAVAGQADRSGDGLSIPWSPPEALGEAPNLEQSDVYSLAATIYTMLAGRAPFEVKGGDNRPLAMMARIERDPVPSIGRADVPVMLERVLVGAMSKSPSARPATAADLALQLQEVESSMQLPVTPLQLRDRGPVNRSRLGDSHDDDATRVKNVLSVDAQITIPRESRRQRRIGSAPTDHVAGANRASAAAPRNRVSATPSGPAFTASSRQREPQDLQTQTAAGGQADHVEANPVDDVHDQTPRSVPQLWIALGALATLIVLTVGITLLFGGGSDSPAPDASADGFGENVDQLALVDAESAKISIEPSGVAPFPLTVVTGRRASPGVNHFTWKDPGGGVQFAVIVDGGSSTEIATNQFTTDQECIQVQVIAPSGLASPPTEGCVS